MEIALREFESKNPFIKIDLKEAVTEDKIFKAESYIMFEIKHNLYMNKYDYEILKVKFIRDQWINSRTMVYYFETEDENIKCMYNTQLDRESILLYRYTENGK